MATDNEKKFLGWDGTEQIVATVKNLLADKLNSDDLPTAVEEALAQAKASGEFDGADGQNGKDGADGKTPVRGTDYWTAADKAEIKAYVDEAILGGSW